MVIPELKNIIFKSKNSLGVWVPERLEDKIGELKDRLILNIQNKEQSQQTQKGKNKTIKRMSEKYRAQLKAQYTNVEFPEVEER